MENIESKTYTTDSGEDKVIIHDDGIFETFTRGTSNALYCGEDPEAARKSLELSEEEWSRLLLSDTEEEINADTNVKSI